MGALVSSDGPSRLLRYGSATIVGTMSPPRTESRRSSSSTTGLLTSGVVLLLAGAGVAVAGTLGSSPAAGPAPIAPAPAPIGVPQGAGDLPRVRAAVDTLLASQVSLGFDGKSVTSTWKELGAVLDEPAV